MRMWLLRLLGSLPLALIHGIARQAGVLLYRLHAPQRSVTEVNLRLCFPQMSEVQRARLARLSLIESAKTLLEMPTLWLADPERGLGLVREVHGEQLVREGLARGKGVIVMSPHLGNWELAGLYCSRHYPITIMYRAQRSAAANALMAQGRSRFGGKLVPATRQGLKELLRALHQGGLVGVLPDQNPGAGTGVFAPFFGVATYTPIFAARLASRTGATALLACAERLPGSRGFRLQISPAGPGFYDASTVVAAACMNADLEAIIRARPEQYWWSYKRFRKRPAGEEPPYHR